MFGDVENPTGPGSEQPALGDLALSRGVGLGDGQRPLPSTAIL